jgi:protein SCO1/2
VRRIFLIAVALAVALVAVSVVFLATRRSARTFSPETTALAPPMRAADFVLESASGSVSLQDLRGKVLVLFFGYTFCPDICPTTMQRLDRTTELLGSDADAVQVVMITVDPERDTPERMRQYVSQFNASFVGLSGQEEAVLAVATDYGIFHARVEREDGGPYTVDHTASVLVLNADGELVLLWPHGMAAEAMAVDLRTLMGG